jgi:hypothetical protein
MMRRLISVVMLVALAGCGSDSNNGGGFVPPTVSTPPPPVDVPLAGAYDLVVAPAAGCSLPGAPYTLRLNVTTFSARGVDELRATLPDGGDALALDMLYPVPGTLQGSLSTRAPVPIPGAGQLFLRDNGWGLVSLAPGARAEVLDGVMVGDVTYYPDGVSAFTCSSTDHSWALVAR